MTVPATVLDTGALLEVVWVSLLAGIGLTLVFSLAIACAARATHQRRLGATAASAGWWLITGLCGALCAVVVVLGVLVMLSK